jgi:hypothetical protein
MEEEEQWLCQTLTSRSLDECIDASSWSDVHAFLFSSLLQQVSPGGGPVRPSCEWLSQSLIGTRK